MLFFEEEEEEEDGNVWLTQYKMVHTLKGVPNLRNGTNHFDSHLKSKVEGICLHFFSAQETQTYHRSNTEYLLHA